MKAIVFAYHDIGCVGLNALAEAGYDIQAVFTHTDNPGENRFSLRSLEWQPSWHCQYLHRKMSTTLCGLNVFVSYSRISFSPSIIATCLVMKFCHWPHKADLTYTVRYCLSIVAEPQLTGYWSMGKQRRV